MSTLKVNTIQDTTGNDALTIDSSGNVTASQGFVPSTQLSHRNLVINGAMQVSQRGTDINDVANSTYTADRWKFFKANADQIALDYDNVSDAPNGFSNSLKVTVATAESTLDTNEWFMIGQPIEGLNLQHLKNGTSSAQDLTVSFWVKSSVTGTYIVNLFCPDFSASPNRKYYSTTYTIDTANTWEYKTVTMSGNTNSGDTISNDNTEGMRLGFMLGASSDFTSGTSETWGSTVDWAVGINNNLVTTTNATWQITGVQLEVGSVATPFEHRSYGEELARCDRYFQRYKLYGSYVGFCNTQVHDSTHQSFSFTFRTPMRSNPSVGFNNMIVTDRIGYDADISSMAIQGAYTDGISIRTTNTTGGSARQAAHMTSKNGTSNAYVQFDAEL